MAVGFFPFALSGVPVWIAYRKSNWLEVGIIWQVVSISMTIIIGVTLFGEPLDWRKIVGFALVLLALAILHS